MNWHQRQKRLRDWLELAYEPGVKHSYSTVNYDLLAFILERITRMVYEDYVKTYVLEEVGMTDSFSELIRFRRM